MKKIGRLAIFSIVVFCIALISETFAAKNERKVLTLEQFKITDYKKNIVDISVKKMNLFENDLRNFTIENCSFIDASFKNVDLRNSIIIGTELFRLTMNNINMN